MLFLVISFAVAGAGSLATFQNVDGWYADADKAFWTPPNVVFGPVWTVLYSLMSVAAWLVWRQPASPARRRALGVYIGQLALNAIWTPVFFGLQDPASAMIVILALDIAVAGFIAASWRQDRPSALAFLPYLAWVLFATALNGAILVLN